MMNERKTTGKRSRVRGKGSEVVAQNPAKSPLSSNPEPRTRRSRPGLLTSSSFITHPRAQKHCGGNHLSLIIPEWLDARVWEDFKGHRTAMKSKMTPQAERLILSRLEELKSRGNDPKEVLLQSIERGWKGVFELSGRPAARRQGRLPDSPPAPPAASNGTAAFGDEYMPGEARSTMWTEQGLQNLRVAEAYISRMGPLRNE
jgi:hypothetical protein